MNIALYSHEYSIGIGHSLTELLVTVVVRHNLRHYRFMEISAKRTHRQAANCSTLGWMCLSFLGPPVILLIRR